jgi:hypothetical protein
MTRIIKKIIPRINPTDTELSDAEATGITLSFNLQLSEESFQINPLLQMHLLLKLEGSVCSMSEQSIQEQSESLEFHSNGYLHEQRHGFPKLIGVKVL